VVSSSCAARGAATSASRTQAMRCPGQSLPAKAWAVATVRGHWVEAEHHMRTALSLSPGDGPIHMVHGNMLGILGHLRESLDEESAVHALVPASLGVSGDNTRLWAPELRPFRVDRRFPAFAKRLGYMEYWQHYGPPDNCDLKDGQIACR
jgi:hypothetical protein